MKMRKRSFVISLAMLVFMSAFGALSASAGASTVQYYKTAADIFDADYLNEYFTSEDDYEQRIGSSASIALGLAGIDTKDKKVGDGSFFQRALTANNGMGAWICGGRKWGGKGYVDASSASRPAFVMWFYIDDVNKMAVGSEGYYKDVFFRVKLGSDADHSLSRNDGIYYSLWFTKESIKTGWNYLVVELKKNYTPGDRYTSDVDGVKCGVDTGDQARVNLSKIDWINFELVAGGKMTWKMDYVQIVDLAVKQSAPTPPTPQRKPSSSASSAANRPSNSSSAGKPPVGQTSSVGGNTVSTAPGGSSSQPNTGSQVSEVPDTSAVSNPDIQEPADESTPNSDVVSDTTGNNEESKVDGSTSLNGGNKKSSAGLIAGIIILAVALLGGGAAFYFLIVKKKQ